MISFLSLKWISSDKRVKADIAFKSVKSDNIYGYINAFDGRYTGDAAYKIVSI